MNRIFSILTELTKNIYFCFYHTIQTIAFLAHLKESGEQGKHLIVVPSSTLDNWRKELDTWAPGLKLVTYWGAQDERRHLRLQLVTDELECDIIEERVVFKNMAFT